MAHIDYEAEIELTREAVAGRLQALATDFEGNEEITVVGDDTTVTVPAPEGHLEYEVEIEREGDGEIELELELEWGDDADGGAGVDESASGVSEQRIDPDENELGSGESEPRFR